MNLFIENFQHLLNTILDFTDYIWSGPMVIILVSLAIFFTFYLNFFQFKYIPLIYKSTFKTYFKPQTYGDGTITPIRAVMTALAAMIGTGNITGVAVAISLGGPGAVFWMFMIALFISIIKFTEICIGHKYRHLDKKSNEWRGGLMYVIINALGPKFRYVAYIWAGLLAIQYLFGPSIQTNAIADTLNQTFNFNKLYVGLIIALLAGIILIGGLKRISSVSAKLVPFMSLLYIISAIIILIINFRNLPATFKLIVSSAFGIQSLAGGLTGAGVTYSMKLAIRNGLARGLLSNEAGMGSAPFFHAPAQTDFPARQALWGIFEVFIDTVIICTLSGLVIVSSGALNANIEGAALTSFAFTSSLPYIGKYIIAISVTLFAFSSLLCDAFIGTSCFKFVLKTNIQLPYLCIILITIVMGACLNFDVIWRLWDTVMMFTVSLNLAVLFYLRKEVKNELNKFLEYLKK